MNSRDSMPAVRQAEDVRAVALAEVAKKDLIVKLVQEFGRQGEGADVKLYLAAVKECTPEQVADACRNIIASGTDFLPRPGLLRRAVDDAALGRILRLEGWKERSREEAKEQILAAIRQAERRKESAIASARAKRLPYVEYARLRDEAITTCRAETARLEQALGRECARIDALQAVPAPEAKVAIEG